MAYNRKNYLRKVRFVVDIYNQHKEYDVPDTFILRNIFPKYGIYMSYRKWMYIKNMKESELPEKSHHQLSLFN